MPPGMDRMMTTMPLAIAERGASIAVVYNEGQSAGEASRCSDMVAQPDVRSTASQQHCKGQD